VPKVFSLLRNPTYAGAYVFGKSRSVPSTDPQSARPKIRQCPQEQWRVLLKDHFPAYIDWDTFTRIQTMLADNYAEYRKRHSRGVPRDGAALLTGLCYCGHCGHKMSVEYRKEPHYTCRFAQLNTGQGSLCQNLRSEEIERFVKDSFFAALTPVELALHDAAYKRIHEQHAEVHLAQERQLQRLRYDVNMARRQYDRVDPDNRLVAAELERRWESALHALRETEQRYEKDQQKMQAEIERQIPLELRTAFASVGQALPGLWPNMPMSTRKALLRCLIDKVVLKRLLPRDRLLLRIVWRGGAYTETELRISVPSVRQMSDYEVLRKRVLELEAEGKSDAQIAELLTQEGFHSPEQDRLIQSTVMRIRRSEGRMHGEGGPRPRRVGGALTVSRAAKLLGLPRHWIYSRIANGVITLDRDEEYDMYLFPNRPDTLDKLRQLRDGLIHDLNLSEGHQDA
jgi:hypothetical protein